MKTFFEIKHFNSVDSTNDVAKRMALDGAPHGMIITADCQTSGRGRFQRHWHSPYGLNVYMSIILRDGIKLSMIHALTALTSVACSKAINSFFPFLDLSIKWPNDIYLNHKKLGGILTESHIRANDIEFIVTGIGINVNAMPDDFPLEMQDRVISLKMATGIETDRQLLIEAILQAFDELYENFVANNYKTIVSDYNKLILKYDRLIESTINGNNITLQIIGIADDFTLNAKRTDNACNINIR